MKKIVLAIVFLAITGNVPVSALSPTCDNCTCTPDYAATHGFFWQFTCLPITQAEADCYDNYLNSECTANLMGTTTQIITPGTPTQLHKVNRDSCTDPCPPEVTWDWTKENGWEISFCIAPKYQAIVMGIGWSVDVSGCYKYASKTSIHFGGKWDAGQAPCANPYVALMKSSDYIKVTATIKVTKWASYDMGSSHSDFCDGVWATHGIAQVNRDDCGNDTETSYCYDDEYTLKTDPGSCPEKCDEPCKNDLGGC